MALNKIVLTSISLYLNLIIKKAGFSLGKFDFLTVLSNQIFTGAKVRVLKNPLRPTRHYHLSKPTPKKDNSKGLTGINENVHPTVMHVRKREKNRLD